MPEQEQPVSNQIGTLRGFVISSLRDVTPITRQAFDCRSSTDAGFPALFTTYTGILQVLRTPSIPAL